jgi:hypothetical protein
MSAECCGAGAKSALPARCGTRGHRIASLLAFAPAALLAIAVPKCPLCLAAQLAFLGASVGAASTIAPLLSPLRIALAILAVGLLLPRKPARSGTPATRGEMASARPAPARPPPRRSPAIPILVSSSPGTSVLTPAAAEDRAGCDSKW